MLWVIFATVIACVVVFLIATNLATPEKKLQEGLDHRFRTDDPQFRREMGVMLGPAIVGGNRIVDLQNGDEIFPAMLREIESAAVSVNLETYIYWSGDVGRRFATALTRRALAGVETNVMIDWAGSLKMDQTLIDEMRDAGVSVHRYRPLRWYNLSRMNNRTHRKLLIVDGLVAFTGGVGIADNWSGNAEDPEHWRDMHFRIEGPVVSQFQAAFNDNWIKTTGEVLHGPEYFPPQSKRGDSDAHLFISSPAGGSESMHLMYLMAISAACESIDLAASYFLPDGLIVRALLEARERGVRIRILLPGRFTDSDATRHASRATWGELLLAGIEIHEYAPTTIHNKLLIVDQEMVSVGSTNFDIRSFRLNDEASLNVYDPVFAKRMTRIFENDLTHAEKYDHRRWKTRPWRQRMLEALVLPFKSQL